MDMGTVVRQVSPSPDIFPFISICPHPPLKHWNEKFGRSKYEENVDAWKQMMVENNLTSSHSLRKFYNELAYDQEDIIHDVSVEYKDRLIPLTQSLLRIGQEEPVPLEICMRAIICQSEKH